ncbi:MAG: 16S rRNA (cytosine(1402)-N(4))-methyltransferase RsmH [Alphaproteobacteria bacterium]|nr:16S rRNA (cytosine(1402)-N(4))-methyltransferase RsmH [Alphaproteobacteria bacterium]
MASGSSSRRAGAATGGHTPVMLAEVLETLAPRDGAVYVDSTFGGGGYSRGLLEAAACRVCAIDRDPAAIETGAALAQRYPGRVTLIQGRFGEMQQLLAPHGIREVDGIAFDLGVSSAQLDDAARGFSFRYDAALDMRMGSGGPSAEEVINGATQEMLADLIYDYGEERRARAIARAIVAARGEAPIRRTSQLADIVRAVVRRGAGGIDPATRTFQALRIYVNDELGELDLGLAASERMLRPGGRLAVVSFHSLEDRRVKAFLNRRAGATPRPSRHLPEALGDATKMPQPSFNLLRKRALKPGAAELSANPRSRSARLRGGERTGAPAWPEGAAP